MKSKDEKGAVSVLVTLLLIPAILVSGTAVDTARIYTAVGILQSANELAANAVQTQYDALLHDLYGLFGISTDEADLEDMAAKYIEASIFGEGEGGGGGALKLFYGSSSGRPELMFDADKNLGNLEVLQRQIEQYIKFRAPALVMGEFFWGFLPGTFGEDIAIVGEKLLIDALLQECLDKFRELYAAITEADRCRSVVGVGSFGSMSASLVSIQEQFSALGECYENYLATDEGTDEKTLYFERLNGIIAKIKQLSAGGSPRLAVWTDGRRDSSGNWVVGHWSTQSSSVVGLAGNIANAKTKAENFKAQFLAVEELAQELDSKKLELSDLIDSLEHRLQAGICGEKLKAGMLEKHGSPPKSLIEAYREALAWELLPLAQKYRGAGDEYIEKVKTMLDNVK
ncbi:MAG: hypothetical protein FWH48_07270, partial [Oscillospiraceae bacterium]|nr:hypothetical protein [Oscillospiraceae bacterium]